MQTIQVSPTWVLTYQQVYEAVRRLAGSDPQLMLLDEKYRGTTLFLNKTLLVDVDATNTKDYVDDFFDCDDFALTLAALWRVRFGLNTMLIAFGSTPFGYHVFNILVASDLKGQSWEAYYVEPQTDGVWDAEENEKRFKYKPTLILG